MDFIHRTKSFRRKVARTLKSEECTKELEPHDSELDEYKYLEKRLNSKSSFISTVASSKDSVTSLNAFFTSGRDSPIQCRDSDESPDFVDEISSLSLLSDITQCDDGGSSSFPHDLNDTFREHSLVSYRHLHCSMSYKSQKSSKHATGYVHPDSTFEQQRRELYVVQKSGTDSDAEDTSSQNVRLRDERIRNNVANDFNISGSTLAIHQARRELQRMVLTAVDDEDNEFDSDSESATFSESNNSNVVRVSEEDLERFRTRLYQLEEIFAEQNRKQKLLEDTIHEQVEQRTRKIIQSAEEKIDRYKRARDLALENHTSQMSPITKPQLSFFRRTLSEAATPSAIDKLLRPIRSKQFSDKQCIDNKVAGSDDSWGISELNSESSNQPHGDIDSVVCVFDEHISYQDMQLENAKELITIAIQERSEAEGVAHEALELATELDKRLDIVMQENMAMKKQLEALEL